METYVQGNASVKGMPILENTTISGINFTITKLGECAEIFDDIVNNGTINSKI